MPLLREIGVANLRADQANPRLSEPRPTNQADTLAAIAEWDPAKLQAIAEDIAEFGLDPSNLMIVTQDAKGSKSYTVFEGNRRLTAIRALTNPSIIADSVPIGVLNAIKNARSKFVAQRIQRVTCVVVGSRSEARHWIEVRHQGIQRGAGTVPWDSVQGARWAAQFGGKKRTLGLLAIDFLSNIGALDEDTRIAMEKRFPLSTLDRLLASPDVRKAIGVAKSKAGDEMVADFPDSEVAKPLTRIVSDLAHRRIKVSHVDTAKLMKKYVKGLGAEDLPNPTTRLRVPHALGADAQPGAKRVQRRRKTSTERTTLIPKDFHVTIGHDRCHDIYLELRKIPIVAFRNAVAVLSRVFIELSIDVFIEKQNLMTPAQLAGSSLGQKMQTAINKLDGNSKLTPHQLQAIRRAARDDSRLAPTIKTMHGYIHNPDMVPLVSDLNAEWKILAPFLQAIWA